MAGEYQPLDTPADFGPILRLGPFMMNRTRFWTFGGLISVYSVCLFLITVALGCATDRTQKPQNRNTMPPHLNLSLLKGRVAICRLSPTERIPEWAMADASFCSVTRGKDELSIVCPESFVPEDIKQEAGWRLFKVAGPLGFELTGILASMAGPLATAGVSIFAVSTFDTDYLMVKEQKLEVALTSHARISVRSPRC
jgi:uncharacterized protein